MPTPTPGRVAVIHGPNRRVLRNRSPGVQRRRWVWSGLLVACAVLVTFLTTAGSAPDGRVRVLQMNLCNSGLAGCYTGRAVATAVEVIRAQAPDVVTLN